MQLFETNESNKLLTKPYGLRTAKQCQVYLDLEEVVLEYRLPCGVWLQAVDRRGPPPSFFTLRGPLDIRPLNWPNDIVNTQLKSKQRVQTKDIYGDILHTLL